MKTQNCARVIDFISRRPWLLFIKKKFFLLRNTCKLNICMEYGVPTQDNLSVCTEMVCEISRQKQLKTEREVVYLRLECVMRICILFTLFFTFPFLFLRCFWPGMDSMCSEVYLTNSSKFMCISLHSTKDQYLTN